MKTADRLVIGLFVTVLIFSVFIYIFFFCFSFR
jgi:hypothetical protein